MIRFLLLAIAATLCMDCFAAPVFGAESTQASPPGTELATAISTITGVAISPLLGVSAVGAWKYAHANTPEARKKLPWYAQPWFWIPAFVIIGICALKDTFGLTIPTALKKPFDILEIAEHKISGMIVAGTFVPMVALVFHATGADTQSLTTHRHAFLAVIGQSWIYNCLSVLVLMAAYVVVFLAGNSINILILLSPFSTVDVALKSFRLFLLSTVTITAFVNPYVGAAWAVVLIVAAYFIAGWSFRLSHFGLSFVWDFFTVRRRRFAPDKTANWMFLGRQTGEVPIRTYGKFFRDAGNNFVFNYRPWLVFPEKRLTLPAANYVVGKGLIYSEIIQIEGKQTVPVMLLPWRYRSHEDELAAIYGFHCVRETGLLAAFAWLKEFMGFKPEQKSAG